MPGSHVRRLVAAAAGASLFLSPTGAIAAARLPAQQISPWATLSFLAGGASAAAVCGASVAATAMQPTAGCVLPVLDAPPPSVAPPAPVLAGGPPPGGYGITPLLAGLLAVAGGIGLFLLVKDHHHANSPA
jgi:hypothetical protein